MSEEIVVAILELIRKINIQDKKHRINVLENSKQKLKLLTEKYEIESKKLEQNIDTYTKLVQDMGE